MAMFFTIPPIRDHLIKHGEVYVLRKKTNYKKNLAVRGFNSRTDRLFPIDLEEIKKVENLSDLEPYLEKSGMPSTGMWFELGKLLWGDSPLYLYKITKRVI
jgi:hypothetical protein